LTDTPIEDLDAAIAAGQAVIDQWLHDHGQAHPRPLGPVDP